MCESSCERMHLDQAGTPGRVLAELAELGLRVLERRNGATPTVPVGTTQLLEMLAANADVTPGAETFFVDCAAAASLLGLSPVRVRVLAKQGGLPGARKIGGGWLIPRSALEYRRSRVA